MFNQIFGYRADQLMWLLRRWLWVCHSSVLELVALTVGSGCYNLRITNVCLIKTHWSLQSNNTKFNWIKFQNWNSGTIILEVNESKSYDIWSILMTSSTSWRHTSRTADVVVHGFTSKRHFGKLFAIENGVYRRIVDYALIVNLIDIMIYIFLNQ